MEFVSGSFHLSQDDISSELGDYAQEWPWDVNGIDFTALLRIKLRNFSTEEARALSFRYPSHCNASKIDLSKIDALSEIWIFLNSVENSYIEALLDSYGVSNRFPISQRLEPEAVYEITLENQKTVTISIASNPSDAVVVIDDVPTFKTTPLQIENVGMGKHTVKLSIDGKLLSTETIEVSENNIHFDFDIRARKDVSFMSDPSGALIYLNDNESPSGKTPCTLSLPYDTYRVVALTSDLKNDTITMAVSDLSSSFVSLIPSSKKPVTLYAEYRGKRVPADLDVDNRYYGDSKMSYTLYLPYGSYDMRMTYDGRYKNKTVTVGANSATSQTISIPKKSTVTMPWERQYDVDPMGFSAGYVQKTFRVKDENGDSQSQDIWGQQGEWLRGFQAGVYFQPAFSFGLGLYTGLFYELYFSETSMYDASENFDRFMEHSLYMPVHLFFRLPFANKVSLSFHGGLGLNCGLQAKYYSSDDYNFTMPLTDVYGKELDGLVVPVQRFNLAGEGAIALRISSVQIYAQYSAGITNNAAEGQNIKVYQNKISCGISWVFGKEYNY